MSSPETENFLEWVQLKFEFTAEEMSNPKMIYQTTGIKFSTGYNHELYKSMASCIKRVCNKIRMAGIELNEHLNITGLQPKRDGPLMQFVPASSAVRLYRNDLDIYPEVFTDAEEIQAVAYLLTMWQNAFMQQIDPEAGIRARLSEFGIRSYEDFEANKDRMMIRNPFHPPTVP
jgi:hypothetical protein